MKKVAPKGEQMNRDLDLLNEHEGLFIKQTKRGCCQELFGCQAKNEFKIAPLSDQQNDVMYSLEESSCFCRFCCKSQRAFKQTVTVGSQSGGDLLMSMDHPFSCPVAACTCCCKPAITFTDGKQSNLGKAHVPFFCCIPNFQVVDQNEVVEYNVHMPTCFGGMCVNCCAEGCCNCKVPFYIYNPQSSDQEIGKIVKIWRGLGTEMFTDADTFQVEFPKDATVEQKARLMGTTIFINMAFFEGKN